MRSLRPQQGYLCQQCGKVFEGNEDLPLHLKKHEEWKLNVVKTPGPKANNGNEDEKLMVNDAGIEVESTDFLDEIVNNIEPQINKVHTTEEDKKVVVTSSSNEGTSKEAVEENGSERDEDEVSELVRPEARLQEVLTEPGAEGQEEGGLQLAPGAGPQEDGRLLQILSTLTPWFRIPHKKQDEGRELATPEGDLQEVVLQEEGRVPGEDLQEVVLQEEGRVPGGTCRR